MCIMPYASNISLLPISVVVDGAGDDGGVGGAAIVAVITFFFPSFCCATQKKTSLPISRPYGIQFC